MALTTVEEAQTRELIAQNAALLSLASNETTITSKLGAQKVNVGQLPAATALADSDILLVRQGTTDKGIGAAALKGFVPTEGRLLRVSIFTASGTWTPGAGTKSVEVELVGGGGAAGGCAATVASQYSSSTGGVGGAYARKFIGNIAAQTVTVGAGGIGVSGNTGGNGGTTSFGSLLSATGGPGGKLFPATNGTTYVANTISSTATGGDVNIPGGLGTTAWTSTAAANGEGGVGGDSQLGKGGAPAINGTGGIGLGYGSGGGGSQNGPSVAANTGANGAPGIVIVREYA